MQQKQHASVFRSILPEILLFGFAVLAFLAALLLPLLSLADDFSADEERLLAAYQQGDVVRIHILANSDTPEDQRIKLLVRDRVLREFGSLLEKAGADSPEEVCRILEERLPEIRSIAEECARENGFTGPVTAEFGLLDMPKKQYGQVVLPAGEYRGLRIVLGDGAGQNWWCILFPQLCLDLLTDDTSSEASDIYWDSLRILRLWTLLPPSDTQL